MTDQVAKALCEAAGRTGCQSDYVKASCEMCDNGVCTLWPSFRYEAQQAILAAYKWHKEHKRWPGWVK